MITDHMLAVITTGLFAAILIVLIAILIAILRLPRNIRGPEILEPVPPNTVRVQRGSALIRSPALPVSAMTVKPAVPTDTQLIPVIEPDDVGVDIVRLNRRPRPINAPDLVKRYKAQHPPEQR